MSIRDRVRDVTAGLLALVLVAAGTSAFHPARAQELEPSVIAVVDLQHLLRDSLAGQAIERQLQQMRSSFGEEVSQQETVLRAEEKELQEQASILAPEVFADKRRQFEEKVVSLQRTVRERQQALEQAYAEGMGQVRGVVVEILQDIVEERGIDLVVPHTAILVGSRKLDITDDVLAALDQRLPSVTLSMPTGN